MEGPVYYYSDGATFYTSFHPSVITAIQDVNMADLGTLPVMMKLFTTSENWSLVRAPTLNLTWKEKAEI